MHLSDLTCRFRWGEGGCPRADPLLIAITTYRTAVVFNTAVYYHNSYTYNISLIYVDIISFHHMNVLLCTFIIFTCFWQENLVQCCYVHGSCSFHGLRQGFTVYLHGNICVHGK